MKTDGRQPEKETVMRINSTDNSSYSFQSHAQKSPDKGTKQLKTPDGEVVARLELSHAAAQTGKVAEAAGLPKNKESKPQAEGKALQEQADDMAKRARELWGKLTEKVTEMTEKLGNFWSEQEKHPTETGVPQTTWQENFRKRIKILFDALTGFLSGHLPMSHGGFAQTKEEQEKETLTGQKETGKEETEVPYTHIDLRG